MRSDATGRSALYSWLTHQSVPLIPALVVSASLASATSASGTIVWKSPQLESGGYFARGDLLARIDPEDYELAITQVEAEVAQARYRLDLMREEAEVARQEWDRLRQDADGREGAPNPLVLQIPQLKAAEAEFKAARARLGEARLRLKRTHLVAPFDGRVRSAKLDAGQYVIAGTPVAQLYSTEKAEIVVPVPGEELAWLDLPQAPSEADWKTGPP